MSTDWMLRLMVMMVGALFAVCVVVMVNP